MTHAFARLRWQLTLSHLAAIACTLVSMIAALVLIVGSFIAKQPATNAAREPVQDAHNVARAINGLVVAGGEPTEISAVLRALASGDLHVVATFGPRPENFDSGLRKVAYISLVDPTGQELASSDPAGAAFAPPERDQWQRAVASGDAVSLEGTGPVALAAAPITDDTGRVLAYVVIAKSSLTAVGGGGLDLVRGLAIFGAASAVVLIAASVFAVISASVVAYLLSRRWVGRLERLGQAAHALAAGDLSQRVEADSRDEVGQLGVQFNLMAADLEKTLGELRAERDRVAGLLEQRRQLIASASHELRTPVATVRGYVESVLARGLPADVRPDLETIEREVQRLQKLIEDLFAIAQTELGKLTLRVQPTDVAPVVQGLVDTSAPLAWRQRRVQVLPEIAPGVPLAMADVQRLEQVVSNLLGNAIRHTPPGGLVAACVASDSDGICIEVRDTGEGITADDLPHVFERFYRGRNNGDVGAGLGLALVAELTAAMGGTVSVDSTPGEGSRFAVHLRRA